MSIVSLVIASLIGYCGVRLWLPADAGRSRWKQALHAALGIGLGMGLTGCLYWLLVVGNIGALPVTLGVELVMLAALGALVLRQRSIAAPDSNTATAPSFPYLLPGVGLAIMVGLFITAFAGVVELNPQGGWDAFSIWNLRARFLLHTATWKFAVTPFPVGAHMEYPLLLSSVVARGWTYGGSPSPNVPIATAFVFAVGLVLLLVSTLALARGASAGLLAGVILLASPAFMTQAPSEYADVPLAFFFLAALALITQGRTSRCLSLAGVFAGFAAWTKNEGALVVVALAAALIVSAWRSTGWRSATRQGGIFLLGALPGLLLVLWFKVALAPPDPLAGQMTVGLGQKFFDGGRWLKVAGGFLKQAWEVHLLPLALLAVTCGLLRLRPRQERSPVPLPAVLLVLGGYFAIFLVTKDDLDWLFATALDRLYMHVWPALVLAVFLQLRRPEDFAQVSTPAKAKKAR
jgi:hypothetical protein